MQSIKRHGYPDAGTSDTVAMNDTGSFAFIGLPDDTFGFNNARGSVRTFGSLNIHQHRILEGERTKK